MGTNKSKRGEGMSGEHVVLVNVFFFFLLDVFLVGGGGIFLFFPM